MWSSAVRAFGGLPFGVFKFTVQKFGVLKFAVLKFGVAYSASQMLLIIR